ncbi:MAG: hypothetical protein K5697_08850 [Lachnospiraceae bacterium]|nr:hypothetical protein [Lachnospiraceae bacterium]
MAINIQAKTDYSSLFSSLNTSRSSDAMTNMSWLSDYSQIKSGTYGKLMKAYYADQGSKTSGTSSAEKSDAETRRSDILSKLTSHTADSVTKKSETQTALSKVSADADALQKSADAVREADLGDTEKRQQAVQSFADSYNALLKSAADADNTSVNNRIDGMKDNTALYKKSLAEIGVNVGSDGKLSVDAEKLAAADQGKVEDLFAQRGSYAYSVGVSAAMAETNANYAANTASTYTANGTYSGVTGSLFEGLV